MTALTSTRALRALVNEIETNAPLATEAWTTHAAVRDSARKLEGELLAAILVELKEAGTLRALAGPKDWVDIITITEMAIQRACGAVGLAVDLNGNLHECTIDRRPGPLCTRFAGGYAWFLEPIGAELTAERFGLQNVLDAIADKLDVAINSHPKSAAKLDRHVSIVRACLVLLRARTPLNEKVEK